MDIYANAVIVNPLENAKCVITSFNSHLEKLGQFPFMSTLFIKLFILSSISNLLFEIPTRSSCQNNFPLLESVILIALVTINSQNYFRVSLQTGVF